MILVYVQGVRKGEFSHQKGAAGVRTGRVIEYLESADVAKILGLTPTRIRQLAAEGIIPVSAQTVSGTRLFSHEVAEQVRLSRLATTPRRSRRRNAA
jgi:hypothetical protein